MYKNKKILALIPARAGSKGLPGKNIKIIAGKPLIEWSIIQAKNSKYVDLVAVTTDGDEIVDIAEASGTVAIKRPVELAEDNSPTSQAVNHALIELEKNDTFDYIILLEPTSPLRGIYDIDNAIVDLVDNFDKADSLVSLGLVQLEHPDIVKDIDNLGYVKSYVGHSKSITRRQQYDKAYFPYGVIYMAKVGVYKNQQTFYTDRTIPYFIERWQNYEIDDQLDFDIVDMIMKGRGGFFNG